MVSSNNINYNQYHILPISLLSGLNVQQQILFGTCSQVYKERGDKYIFLIREKETGLQQLSLEML